MDIQHLILKGTALREQFKKAEEAFDQKFITPVRDWLRTQPDMSTDVLGICTPYIRINKAKATIDEDLVYKDLQDAIAQGAIKPDELVTMVMNGTLGIGNPEMAAAVVALKTHKSVADDYTNWAVAKKEDSVQWREAYKGAKEDLTGEFKRLQDLEDVVLGAARTELRPDVITRLAALGAGKKK